MGLLVWAENGHSNVNKTTETGDHITREMVRQNYNHPSIVIWSVGNETGVRAREPLRRRSRRPRTPTASITYASNTGGKGKKRYPDLDLIAHNTYRGWYRGAPWEFEQKALEMGFISENGAGAVITNHTDYADARHEVDHFEPEEYRQLMAEVQMQVVFRDHAAAHPDVPGLDPARLRHRQVQGRAEHQGPADLRELQEGRLVPLPGLPPPRGAGRPHHEQDLLPPARARATTA